MNVERQQVESVVRAFGEAWNRHDMESLARLFAPDADFVNPVGLWWRGREKIKQAHVATHATLFKCSHVTFGDVAIRFIRPDVAVTRTSWTMTGHISPLGEALPKRQGLLVNLLAYDDGEWKIVDSQNTDIGEG